MLLFQDDFEDYSDDFEEESRNDSDDKGESSNSGSSEERGEQDKQNSKIIGNLITLRAHTSDNNSLINNECYDNSPLLQRLVMNRRRSDDNVQPFQVCL